MKPGDLRTLRSQQLDSYWRGSTVHLPSGNWNQSLDKFTRTGSIQIEMEDIMTITAVYDLDHITVVQILAGGQVGYCHSRWLRDNTIPARFDGC